VLPIPIRFINVASIAGHPVLLVGITVAASSCQSETRVSVLDSTHFFGGRASISPL
jgi:hypothetical protein